MAASDAHAVGKKAEDARRGRPDEAVQALRQRLEQLAETQRWVHHVADLDTGKVLTHALRRPVAPLSRAEGLSRLGHHFDTSIFDGPEYELTPRRPFQSAPRALLIVSSANAYNADADTITWNPPRNPGTNFVFRGMQFRFAEPPHSPNQRSVVSLALSGKAFKGLVGHVRVLPFDSAISVEFPITDVFAAHTLDVTYVPRTGVPQTIDIQIVANVELLTFTKVTFAAEPPVLDPGAL
jgi:hypothetical protein